MSSRVASTFKVVEDVPDMSWKQAVTWDFGDDGATQLLPPTTILLFCSLVPDAGCCWLIQQRRSAGLNLLRLVLVKMLENVNRSMATRVQSLPWCVLKIIFHEFHRLNNATYPSVWIWITLWQFGRAYWSVLSLMCESKKQKTVNM